MKKYGKWIALILAVLTVGIVFTSCNKKTEKGKKSDFDKTANIAVLTREDGSGTRGAFIELVGLETKESRQNNTECFNNQQHRSNAHNSCR